MKATEFIKKLVNDGVSQSEIARKIGVANGTITKYLYSETEPQKETIKKIAKAYGKPMSFFMDDFSDSTVIADPPPQYKPKTPARLMAEQQLDELSEEELTDLIYHLLGRKRPPFTDGYEPPK